jgi:hypothetical protein
MNIAYLIYQAERKPSAAEQRDIDTRRGELASGLAHLMSRRPSAADPARNGSQGRNSRRRQAAGNPAGDRQLASPELACR